MINLAMSWNIRLNKWAKKVTVTTSGDNIEGSAYAAVVYII